MLAANAVRVAVIAMFVLTAAGCAAPGEGKPAAAPAGGGASAAGTETKPAAATGVGAPAAESAPLGATSPAPAAASAGPAVPARPGKDQRAVYYGFDKYNIDARYKPVVEANAKFLVDHPDMKITVQGNTDERGSREYNLALGQRRADGVRRAMLLLGARESQVDAVSFGEEKALATGHDEQAWAQNRRSDIVYQDGQ
jgi:peptidoglycan-associated lipoprotein